MAKEPLALAKVQQCTLAQGKVLGATRHGASVPLSVFTAYKPPGPSLEILPVLTEYVRHLGDKPWCLGGDFNLNPCTGVSGARPTRQRADPRAIVARRQAASRPLRRGARVHTAMSSWRGRCSPGGRPGAGQKRATRWGGARRGIVLQRGELGPCSRCRCARGGLLLEALWDSWDSHPAGGKEVRQKGNVLECQV